MFDNEALKQTMARVVGFTIFFFSLDMQPQGCEFTATLIRNPEVTYDRCNCFIQFYQLH